MLRNMMFTTTPRQQIKMDPLSIPETVITQMSKESFSSLLKDQPIKDKYY